MMSHIRKYIFVWFFALLASLFLMRIVFADEPLKVEAFDKGKFARVLIHSKQSLSFTLNNKDNVLKIKLNRAISLSGDELKNLSSSITNYIGEAKTSNGGRELLLSMKFSNLKTRQFLGEGFVGFDIVKNPDSEAIEAPAIVIKKASKPVQKKTEIKSEKPIDIDPQKSESVAPLVDKTEEKPSEVKSEIAPVEEKKPEEVKTETPVVDEKRPAEVKAETTPVEEKKPEEVKPEASIVEEKKPAEVKVETAPVEEKKPEEVKPEIPVVEEKRPAEVKTENAPSEEKKPEEVKPEIPVISEEKPAEVKTETAPVEEKKPEELKQENTPIKKDEHPAKDLTESTQPIIEQDKKAENNPKVENIVPEKNIENKIEDDLKNAEKIEKEEVKIEDKEAAPAVLNKYIKKVLEEEKPITEKPSDDNTESIKDIKELEKKEDNNSPLDIVPDKSNSKDLKDKIEKPKEEGNSKNFDFVQNIKDFGKKIIRKFETAALTEKDIGSSVGKAKLENVEAEIKFSFDDKVGAAVFQRGGYLWTVFDTNKKFDVDKIVSENNRYFSEASSIENKYYTILRFKLNGSQSFVVDEKGNDWILGIIEKNIFAAFPPKVIIDNNQLSGSTVIISGLGDVKPLRMLDPEMGDQIVVIPVKTADTGFKERYTYPDYNFIKTYQGGVVEIISDGVVTDVTKKGVEVIGPTNKLSGSAQAALRELQEKERLAKLKEQRLKEQIGDLNVFKFNSWKVGNDKTFKDDLDNLLWKVTEADWSEKNEQRLNLARFYFANKLYIEALGVIRVMRDYDKDFVETNDVKIVEAASLYMNGNYDKSIEKFNEINTENYSADDKKELDFWKSAAILKKNSQIKVDKFISANPIEEKKKEESKDKDGIGDDDVENTKLMLSTSERLLKIIRKIDPNLVNAEEVQQLEATARFVTNHFQEAIRRFEETDLYKSGDSFEADDGQLWWSASESNRATNTELSFLENMDGFLRSYPDEVFNDFLLLSLENRLTKNDLSYSEKLLNSFKEEKRERAKNNKEFLLGLFYAKDEEDEKAIATWKKLIDSDVFDRYNRARAKLAMTTFLLNKGKITTDEAIENLNSIRVVWRGDIIEFNVLRLLGEFYVEQGKFMDGFKVWREAIAAFSGSDESLLIAKKMSDKFVQIFNQGEIDKLSQIDALALYYEFRELTPIGKLGDEMIGKLVDRLVKVDLLSRAAALLTHQVRFRLSGEAKDLATIKLIKIHMMNNDPRKALDVLDATENSTASSDVADERKYLRAKVLIDMGKSNQVLALLKNDDTQRASFLRADVYWRNKVWKKVVDELEPPFRDIRREEKALNDEESDQLLRLAVSYALSNRPRRLEVLYDDFVEFVPNKDKKNILTFVATNKGPVNIDALDYTVEYSDMKDFLDNYFKSDKILKPDSQPAQASVGG